MKPILFGWAVAAGLSLASTITVNAADLAGPVPDRIARAEPEGYAPRQRCAIPTYQGVGGFFHPWRQTADQWPPDGRKNRFDPMTTQFLVQGGILICGQMPDWPSAAGPEQMRGANGFSWN
jgi:hypothetical protein